MKIKSSDERHEMLMSIMREGEERVGHFIDMALSAKHRLLFGRYITTPSDIIGLVQKAYMEGYKNGSEEVTKGACLSD